MASKALFNRVARLQQAIEFAEANRQQLAYYICNVGDPLPATVTPKTIVIRLAHPPCVGLSVEGDIG